MMRAALITKLVVLKLMAVFIKDYNGGGCNDCYGENDGSCGDDNDDDDDDDDENDGQNFNKGVTVAMAMVMMLVMK